MNVLLVYPPVANVTQPYLSIPTLVGFLRREGVAQVRTLDCNVEAVDRLLTPDRLRRTYRWCYHRLSSGTVDGAQLSYLRSAVAAGARVADEIEGAKRVFRCEEFNDRTRYIGALRTILAAYLVLSARYYPTVFSHGSFAMGYRCDTSAELLQAVADRDHNPFGEIIASILEEAFARDGVPDILGISVGYYEQLIPGLTLAAIVKQRWPSVHVTLGGTMITALDGKTLTPELFELFDSLVFYEGETALVELIRAVEARKDLRGIPNLACCVDGTVHYPTRHAPLLPADELPSPDFDDLSSVPYFSPSQILPVAASRGCYWRRCTFCTRQHLQHAFRLRKVDKIVDELEQLHALHGARHFFFVDECISPSMLRRLACKLIERDLDIGWSCYARFERGLDDPELCALLARSGLSMIYFGLESACERILDLMDKGTPKDRISRIIQATSSVGIMNMVLYFVGFPTETREEALETMEFLLDHEDHVAFAIAGKFMLEERSPIFNNPADFGVCDVQPLSSEADLNIIYNYRTVKGMTDAEIDEVQAYVNERTQHLQSAEILNRSHLLLLGSDYIDASRPPRTGQSSRASAGVSSY